MKRFIEVRSADGGPPEMAAALAALWKGLFYDAEALEGALQLLQGYSMAQRVEMQQAAAQDAHKGHGNGFHLGELARELVKLSREGLTRLSAGTADETHHLNPLQAIVDSGETLADRLVAEFGAGPFDDKTRRALMSRSSIVAAS